MIRVLTGLLLTLVLVIVLWAQQNALPSVVQLSRLLIGEHWYAITLHDQHVGYLHTSALDQSDGTWQYSTHTHVLMQAGEPVNIRKELVFASRAPYQLRSAEQQTRRGRGLPEIIRLKARDDGQLVRAADGSGTQGQGFVFTLEDYLRVEHWLRDEHPAVDTRLRAPTLSFERAQIGSTGYTLRATSPAGYVLSSEGAVGRTTTHLNRRFLAETIEVGDVFRFTLTDKASALAVASPAFKTSYLLPVENRLRDTHQIRRMTLEVVNDDNAPIATIDAYRQRLSDTNDDSDALLNPSATSIPDLAAMARAILAQLPQGEDAKTRDGRTIPTAQLADLVLAAVHERLAYQEAAPADSLDQVLARGYGECTDFADLFTALAQATGLPARTVIGLAYQDRKPYGFAFHAWNEARVDGQWQVIDPTWNQRIADATHLPLSDRELANLKVYGSRQEAHIIVTGVVRDTPDDPQ